MRYLILLLIVSACSSLQNLPVHKKALIWIDTDPALGIRKDGYPQDIDDGLAIVEFLNSDEVEILGISTVFGNASSNDGQMIANKLLALKEQVRPVAEGCSSAGIKAEKDLPPAIAMMKAAIENAESPVTIVALGPLTNIANLIHYHPQTLNKIEKVIAIMGRSPDKFFFIGEQGPVRDFNYTLDPESTQAVVKSKVPMTLLPFELTSQVEVTKEDLDQISEKNTPVARYLHQTSQQWLNFWVKNFPSDKGIHPWDSASVAYLIEPSLLECEKRGFRFRDVSDSAHGVGRKSTGKQKESQPWFELGEFETEQLEICLKFAPEMKDKFIAKLMERIY